MTKRVAWTIGIAAAIFGVIVLTVVQTQPHARARMSLTDSSGPLVEALEPPSLDVSWQSAPTASSPDDRTPRPRSSERRPRPASISHYDARNFDRMAWDWERERDDPEWSLNFQTIIGAILETADDDSGAMRLQGLSVRCRASACRVDLNGELGPMVQLFNSCQQLQLHVTHHPIPNGDGGAFVEAYVGRELGEPVASSTNR